MVKLPNPLPAGSTHTTNVTVWSTRKKDRGQFNIYVGTTLLVSSYLYYLYLLLPLDLILTLVLSLHLQGTASQYTSANQETSTERVFYRQK